MKNYLFLFNGTKPTIEQDESLDDIVLNNFSLPCLLAAQRLGYNVFVGINRKYAENLKCSIPGIRFYNACIYRSLLDFRSNYQAFNNLMALLNKERIDVIHCNTPIGGILGRVCGNLKNVPQIIYTAHGFHFYKGNSLVKNCVFKTAEELMAKLTDAIITINEEDYTAAKKFQLRNNGKVFRIPGVGINTNQFKSINNKIYKREIRKSLGIDEDKFFLISAGDLVSNKNYPIAIKAIAKLRDENLHYLICGTGPLKSKLEELAFELNVDKQIHFLGYRKDIINLMLCSDIFISTSLREGLSRSVMEAMASGLPCLVSKIRGNTDLITEGKGGCLIEPNNEDQFASKIAYLVNNPELRIKMGMENLNNVNQYDVNNVTKIIESIYEEVLMH
ncbi:putative glycosyltransferase EpsD [bioreactor metagenome]|uniref:Putative glycosyltransferase EpsD n=1 Tax=bioreactor metagenome TaxID=1076179 RepID=A0A644XDR5_9ZZZZ